VVSFDSEAMVACTRCSVITSNEDVASSNTITCGLERFEPNAFVEDWRMDGRGPYLEMRARAMHTRWVSPPLSCTPPGPITESIWLGKPLI
jgi:hypothetical protein